MSEQPLVGLTPRQAQQKRVFDIVVAGAAAVITAPLSIGGIVLATMDTREWGVFSQERVGRSGITFRVHKIRTMRTFIDYRTTVTAAADPRITRVGRVLRRFKIDELPQLIDVLLGHMSVVGPRPDVPGFADILVGRDRVVLAVDPGITGPASLAFRHEEDILAGVADPEKYNRDVIWPAKVRINREYVEHWTIGADVRCVWDTIRTVSGRHPGDLS